MFGGKLTRMFAVKCILNCFPFRFLIVFALSVTFGLAYLAKIIEGPVCLMFPKNDLENVMDFRYLSNCFWYILVTMATVGFGDYYPRTNLGRIIGLIAAFTGTIMVSLLIIAMQQALQLSTMQYKTVDFVDRLKCNEKITKEGSQYLVFNTLRYLKDKRKYMEEVTKENHDPVLAKKLKENLTKSTYKRIQYKKKVKRAIQ